MLFKKTFLTSVICSLLVTAQLLGQAGQVSVTQAVQARKKGSFFRMGKKIFTLPQAGITSLDGIEQVEGIGKAWFIGLSGNKLEVLKANSFNFPVFKDLKALDLSKNKISTIEPGAFNGLGSLQFLWLGSNLLQPIPDGAMQGLNNVKFVFIPNNPGAEALQKQIQKQLPKANVYITTVTKEILKTAAIAAGIALAVVGVIVAAIFVFQKPTEAPKKPATAPSMPQPTVPEFTEKDFFESLRAGEAPESTEDIEQFKDFLKKTSAYNLLRFVNEDVPLRDNYDALEERWKLVRQGNKDLAWLVILRLRDAKEKLVSTEEWLTVPKKEAPQKPTTAPSMPQPAGVPQQPEEAPQEEVPMPVPSAPAAGPSMPKSTLPAEPKQTFPEFTEKDFFEAIKTGKAPQSADTEAIKKFKEFLNQTSQYKLLRFFNEDAPLKKNYMSLIALWHPDTYKGNKANKELATAVAAKLNIAKDKFETDSEWRATPKEDVLRKKEMKLRDALNDLATKISIEQGQGLGLGMYPNDLEKLRGGFIALAGDYQTMGLAKDAERIQDNIKRIDDILKKEDERQLRHREKMSQSDLNDIKEMLLKEREVDIRPGALAPELADAIIGMRNDFIDIAKDYQTMGLASDAKRIKGIVTEMNDILKSEITSLSANAERIKAKIPGFEEKVRENIQKGISVDEDLNGIAAFWDFISNAYTNASVAAKELGDQKAAYYAQQAQEAKAENAKASERLRQYREKH